MKFRKGFGAVAMICALPLVVPATAADGDAGKIRELVGVLDSIAAPLAEKARACQQLAIVGTSDAVPALAALLGDERLGHYAREALEAMALPVADAALRDALGRVQGAQLIGVVNSLGTRRDVAAVPSLLKHAADPTSRAAFAALLALARIGSMDATNAVRSALVNGPEPLRTGSAEAGLLIAEASMSRGDRTNAIAWYDAVRAATVPPQLKLSALRGAILARQAAGFPLLVESLRSGDEQVRAVALRAIRELSGADVTLSLAKEIERLPANVRALAITALVDRGDGRALTTIESQATAGEQEVQIAVLRALGKLGKDSSVPFLLKAIGSGSTAAVSEAAQRSLVQIQATNTDDAMLEALRSADAQARLKLIATLGERGSPKATPRMLQLARETDPAISGAALRALPLVARPADLPDLITLALALPADDARTLADRAIHAVSMKILEPERRAEPLLNAFRKAKDPTTRAALLRPVGAVVRAMGGHAEARSLVTDALRDRNDAVRDAAVKCLADWPDASTATALLEFIRAEPDASQRSTAFDGLARMAADVAAGRDRTSLDALACLTQLNAAARTDAERMKVVSGLGNVKQVEAYRMLLAHLEVPAVKTEAALAIVQIAPALLNGAEAAAVKSTLQRIAETETDGDVRAKAARLTAGVAPAPKKGKGKAK